MQFREPARAAAAPYGYPSSWDRRCAGRQHPRTFSRPTPSRPGWMPTAFSNAVGPVADH